MASATEPFPDAGKMLFGQSFEEKIKQRNGTVKIISAANAKKPNQQFFEGGRASSIYHPWQDAQAVNQKQHHNKVSSYLPKK